MHYLVRSVMQFSCVKPLAGGTVFCRGDPAGITCTKSATDVSAARLCRDDSCRNDFNKDSYQRVPNRQPNTASAATLCNAVMRLHVEDRHILRLFVFVFQLRSDIGQDGYLPHSMLHGIQTKQVTAKPVKCKENQTPKETSLERTSAAQILKFSFY